MAAFGSLFFVFIGVHWWFMPENSKFIFDLSASFAAVVRTGMRRNQPLCDGTETELASDAMKLAVAVVILLHCYLLSIAGAASPEEMIERLRTAARMDAGTSPDARGAKEDLLQAGPTVIPYLLELLLDDDKEVRRLAAWTLAEIKGLSDERSDRGEFGGEIVYVDKEKETRVLAPENTEAIYKTRAGIVAVTGLAHMDQNTGCLFRITKDAGGHWGARRWRELPGAPRFSRLLKDGNLFVSCFGGVVLVSPDGGMRSLKREEVL